MQHSEAYHWLIQGEKRQCIIQRLKQPMTAKQLSRLTGIPLNQVGFVLHELKSHGLIECLNKQARRSRVYWLTAIGIMCRNKLREMVEDTSPAYCFPVVDWNLYGWVCFSHRSAIIKVLTEPLQPSEIKRRARYKYLELKMSANNVRDVIRLFLEKGIVIKVYIKRKAHPKYVNTELGKKLQQLLNSVDGFD